MPKEPYTGSDIQHLSGFQAIRKRPGMYVGERSGDLNVNILIQEALCISLDNLLAGQASQLAITLAPDGSAIVADDGDGLSLETLNCGQTLTEVMFTAMHAGCRYHKNDPENSHLCGPGMVCVTALSAWLVVDNKRDGFNWQTRFEQGEACGPVQQMSPTTETGLQISFIPDPSIFGDRRLCPDKLRNWFGQLPISLPSGCRISLVTPQKSTSLFPLTDS
ncbi:MAG: hypothetical protein ABJZ55_16330 [Fuerstiella sp.]